MLKNKILFNILETKDNFISKEYLSYLHNNNYKYIYYKGRVYVDKGIPDKKFLIIKYAEISNKDIKKISKFIKKNKINGNLISEEHNNIYKKQIKNNNEINNMLYKIKISLGIIESKWI